MDIPSSVCGSIRDRLLDWFGQNQRDLPWRRTRDPYAILVSEVMLQQTQVETVIPYYLNFMKEFPDLDSLAVAPEERVLALWSGLGYYRRARNLQACAREVVDHHGGIFPREKASILDLPGIGPYTAGAILSIALDLPEALVDGNVERVLTRLFTIEKDLSKAVGKRMVWELAGRLVPHTAPGHFNQALMELGATVCRPTNPDCGACVLSDLCLAKNQSRVSDFPVKTKRTQRTKVRELLLLLEVRDHWLVVNSNQEAIYQGLWQFPWIWMEPKEKEAQAMDRICSNLNLESTRPKLFLETRHAVTHRDIQTRCFHLRVPRRFRPSLDVHPEVRWVPIEGLKSLPLPGYQKKVVHRLENEFI